MIETITFSNFCSFYEETELSFAVSKKPQKTFYDVEFNDKRINKVVTVIGPNGSGKTHFLRPLAFISWFITSSFSDTKPDDEIPYEPHALHSEENSKYEILFTINENEYKYNLEISENSIIHESLYKKTSHLYSYIFVREKIGESFSYKQKEFGLQKTLHDTIKKNCSVISAAYSFNVEESFEIVKYFNNIKTNIGSLGRDHYHDAALFTTAEYFNQNKDIFKKAEQIMCDLDLGLSEINIDEFTPPKETGRKENVYIPYGVHESASGEKFKIPLFSESSGTKSAFVLLKLILPVLETGGVAIIDELDNDLHPHMLPFFLDLFKFEHTNPKNAQLIFSCHTPEVLNLLQKHQVYLIEKIDLESEAWRLDEVKGIRSDDNLYAKYQAGALEAVPNI